MMKANASVRLTACQKARNSQEDTWGGRYMFVRCGGKVSEKIPVSHPEIQDVNYRALTEPLQI